MGSTKEPTMMTAPSPVTEEKQIATIKVIKAAKRYLLSPAYSAVRLIKRAAMPVRMTT